MRPRILYAVLDWGLGHATRSIAVIEALNDLGAEVILAGEGNSLVLLKKHFPELESVTLNGLQVKYPSRGPDTWWALTRLNYFHNAISEEHKQVVQLVARFKPDLLISDHRYGVWSDHVPSVFIAHQLRLLSGNKITDTLLSGMHIQLLKRFNAFWVPDFSGDDNLSGILSHHVNVLRQFNPEFIGPLSRFSGIELADIPGRYEVLCICSGPEPSRSRMENMLSNASLDAGKETLLLQGIPSGNSLSREKNLTKVSHLPGNVLASHIINTPAIICRSGYSTIMDLVCLQRTACCIPTPGQTEQEYLAKYLSDKNYITTMNEDAFNFNEALNGDSKNKFPLLQTPSLKVRIKELLLKMHVSIEPDGIQ